MRLVQVACDVWAVYVRDPNRGDKEFYLGTFTTSEAQDILNGQREPLDHNPSSH